MTFLKSNSILTVGSMAFDSISSPAGKVDSVLGGSVNYFSVAASFFSGVEIVAVVGEDFPRSHLDWLKNRGIDVNSVQVVAGKTFHWSGSYDDNLNEAKTLATELNVFERFEPRMTDTQKRAKYVFLANIDPVLQQTVLDQTTATDLIAADSMNFWISSKREELKKTLKRVDILSINEGEARMLSGQIHLKKSADVIRDLGPSVVVIKRGEYGAVMFTGDSIFSVPAYPVMEVADPTGAGDTFAGAFMGYLAKKGVTRRLASEQPLEWERQLRRAMVHGCVMASFTVEDFGLHRLMRLRSDEFQLREQSLIRMISLDPAAAR